METDRGSAIKGPERTDGTPASGGVPQKARAEHLAALPLIAR